MGWEDNYLEQDGIKKGGGRGERQGTGEEETENTQKGRGSWERGLEKQDDQRERRNGAGKNFKLLDVFHILIFPLHGRP